MQERGHEIVMGTSPFFETHVSRWGLESISLGDSSLEQMMGVISQLESIATKPERVTYYHNHWLLTQRDKAIPQIAKAAYQADYFMSNTPLSITRNGFRIPSASVLYDPTPVGHKADLERCTLALRTQKDHATDTTPQGVHSINLVALNKMLIDPDNQWGRTYQFTGFWHDETLYQDWEPPEDLRYFMYGAAPVVLTLGSMASFNMSPLVETFIAALQLSEQRGVLVGSNDQVEALVKAKSDQVEIVCAADVPYDWLLPRASCVIHHGGVGVVSSVLRAGVPSILIPQIPSQVTCSETLMHHQLASGLFELTTLAPTTLADAITKAVSDPTYSNNAQFWQTIVGNEDGVQIAADMIEAHWERLVNIPGATGRFQELR